MIERMNDSCQKWRNDGEMIYLSTENGNFSFRLQNVHTTATVSDSEEDAERREEDSLVRRGYRRALEEKRGELVVSR